MAASQLRTYEKVAQSYGASVKRTATGLVYEKLKGVNYYAKGLGWSWMASADIPTELQWKLGGKKTKVLRNFDSEREAGVGLDLWAVDFFGADNCREYVSKAEAAVNSNLYELRTPDDPSVQKAIADWMAAHGEPAGAAPIASESDSAAPAAIIAESSSSSAATAAVAAPSPALPPMARAAAALRRVLDALLPFLSRHLPGIDIPMSSHVQLRRLRDSLGARPGTPAGTAWILAALDVAGVVACALEAAEREDGVAVQACVYAICDCDAGAAASEPPLPAATQTHAAASFTALCATQPWHDVVEALKLLPPCALVLATHDTLVACQRDARAGAGDVASSGAGSAAAAAVPGAFRAAAANAFSAAAIDALAAAVPVPPAPLSSSTAAVSAVSADAALSSSAMGVQPSVGRGGPQQQHSADPLRSFVADTAAAAALSASVFVLETVWACRSVHTPAPTTGSTASAGAKSQQLQPQQQPRSRDADALITVCRALSTVLRLESACVQYNIDALSDASLSTGTLSAAASATATATPVDDDIIGGSGSSGGESAAPAGSLADRIALASALDVVGQRLRHVLLRVVQQ